MMPHARKDTDNVFVALPSFSPLCLTDRSIGFIHCWNDKKLSPALDSHQREYLRQSQQPPGAFANHPAWVLAYFERDVTGRAEVISF